VDREGQLSTIRAGAVLTARITATARVDEYDRLVSGVAMTRSADGSIIGARSAVQAGAICTFSSEASRQPRASQLSAARKLLAVGEREFVLVLRELGRPTGHRDIDVLGHRSIRVRHVAHIRGNQ